jgi:hypothetical protein
VFSAAFSLALLGACCLPYYKVSIPSHPLMSSTVIGHQLGAWRIAIPGVAVLAVLFGIVNSILRVGVKGAVPIFVGLRVLCFAQLGLWIMAIFVHRYGTGVMSPTPSHVGVTVGWLAYSAVPVAAVALVGSFASLRRRETVR